MPSDIYSVTLGHLKILAPNTNALPESKEQINWLRNELENSKARWNLVIGHKPIHSYGYHKDVDFMVADVLPILCGSADLYFSAHEYNEQVLSVLLPRRFEFSVANGFLQTDQNLITLGGYLSFLSEGEFE